ncbi:MULTISPECIES: TfuA-like protein [unclassified Ensifer]|uniref:TfuA-like protein n=1 Tax=unclassified Ensifer TaxID=2633371 RepID=UPI000709DF79|nr:MULTISPECIES: TfuA-like protein [unclassified Ensifer]KQW33609.1 antibiotic resistance protein [Ensifer sp. Root1252]KQW56868.1 antibiotic resistance protein [Ensifer sp. Root127]KRC78783.1 antibiotic resistance protein [Ensifer sp. Root231]KRD02686.1 antibiotic resistance protein [Ensifer sp. Root258]
MKILFAGPTLPDAQALIGTDIVLRPPAVQGDILRATQDGATVIGLVDGHFEQVAPVWHKEILFALSEGVRIYGAASMGALRAAECATFGMIGVGRIYQQYATGELEDDADVALLHGPAELGYLPLTLPLVNVVATLEDLRARQQIDAASAAQLRMASAEIFYKHRNWSAIVARANLPPTTDLKRIEALLTTGSVDQKRLDALDLLDIMRSAPAQKTKAPGGWAFNSTSLWKRLLNQLVASS